MACFVCIPLNAARYNSPASKYFKDYAPIIRLWIIPFCVSSISIGCNNASKECKLLFPTNTQLLLPHIGGMIGIISIGCIIHFVLLPLCLTQERSEAADKHCVHDNEKNHMNGTDLENENEKVAADSTDNYCGTV